MSQMLGVAAKADAKINPRMAICEVGQICYIVSYVLEHIDCKENQGR